MSYTLDFHGTFPINQDGTQNPDFALTIYEHPVDSDSGDSGESDTDFDLEEGVEITGWEAVYMDEPPVNNSAATKGP
jgi:hypothetical protein